MIDRSFWTPAPLTAIPFLAELRSFVLERSHSRLPKWRFRLADDLVVQLQPRPAERRDRYFLFAGQALQGRNLTADVFKTARAARGHYGIGFGITDAGDSWSIQPTRASWDPHDSSREARLVTFQARVRSALRADRFDGLTPAMMLAPACLICGKALTDPVSIARWIGPECFGSATVIVPWVMAAKGGAA